ncbi:MAG: ADP-ribosylglycohydrolase family protein [Candidatus Riflebacteria bacterium]|nr:ADP-ribosylglycohydrolase family protein [Candidatus Riflebacteria bacterium]
MGDETSGPDLLGRFRGTLLGCAVGDALGAPYQGKPRSFFLAGAVGLDEFQRLPGYPPGQYTDDTQLTLAVAESLIACGTLNAQDVGRRFGLLFSRREILSPERSTVAAIERLMGGVDALQAAAPEGEAGNTPIKCVSPLGLWFHDRSDHLANAAAAVGRVTHRDKRCQAGAVGMARAVNYCLDQKKLVPGSFLEAVSRAMSGHHGPFAQLVAELEAWIGLPEDSALPRIVSAGAGPAKEVDPSLGIPATVVPTLLGVFYFFLRYHDDFELCMHETVRAGGAIDTTASMVASLMGAFHGMEILPENLVTNVHNFKHLVDVAERLYRRKTSN